MSTFNVVMFSYLGLCALIFIGVLSYGIIDDRRKTYVIRRTTPNLKSFDFYHFLILVSAPFINLLTLTFFVVVGLALLYQEFFTRRHRK